MRHRICAQIIHYDIATKNGISEDDVNLEKLLELCDKHKAIIEEQNEQAFMNVVITDYEETILSADKS
jgi:hypothetical protein